MVIVLLIGIGLLVEGLFGTFLEPLSSRIWEHESGVVSGIARIVGVALIAAALWWWIIARLLRR